MDVQIYARPHGRVQFVCPRCSAIQGSTYVNFRHGRVVCKHCMRRFIVGMAFHLWSRGSVPYNAQWVNEPPGETVNTLSYWPTGKPMVGRVSGPVRWKCPFCERFHTSNLDWDLCSTYCPGCDRTYYVSLLLYSPKRGYRSRTPLDWVIPDVQVSAPAEPVAPEAPAEVP